MKIKEITAKKVRLELRQPVVIALGSISHSETVIVKIETDEGLVGYGEGSGATFVTGESADMIVSAVLLLKRALIGLDPFSIDSIHHLLDKTLVHNAAAKAAIDIALYDIMGQYAKLPLYRLLGGMAKQMETDRTIGIGAPEDMAKEAVQLAEQGFRQIKVKAGLNPDDDIEAIRRIREAVGRGHPVESGRQSRLVRRRCASRHSPLCRIRRGGGRTAASPLGHRRASLCPREIASENHGR
ncbi:hypothetical protein HMSSN036_66260 [Paenibacillus macerans]|nr:hypothetical protein HMSSN036_66260 [Paenibacillus macerans]